MRLFGIGNNQIESRIFLLTTGFFVFLCILILCTRVARGQELPANLQENIQDGRNYRIGPGDIIDVIVGKNETLTRSGIRIGNQGTIQLSMIDEDIIAACKTERELADLIREKYKKYLLNPQVIVTVKEYNSTPVAVIGAVTAPIRFQLQRPMRLLEALTLGNGPGLNAGTTVQIIRSSDSLGCGKNLTETGLQVQEDLIIFNLADTLKAAEQSNPFVQAGDIVRVVEAEKVKTPQAYLIGNVTTAKAVDLDEPVTLTQALAMAGGTTEGAQTDRIKISRRTKDSLNKTEIVVSLKEINKQKADDIILEPNDIVEVPGPSRTQKFLKDIFRSVVRLPVGGIIPF